MCRKSLIVIQLFEKLKECFCVDKKKKCQYIFSSHRTHRFEKSLLVCTIEQLSEENIFERV
jgi:hypothetical protein